MYCRHPRCLPARVENPAVEKTEEIQRYKARRERTCHKRPCLGGWKVSNVGTLCIVIRTSWVGVYRDQSLQFIGCMSLEFALSFYVSFHDECQPAQRNEELLASSYFTGSWWTCQLKLLQFLLQGHQRGQSHPNKVTDCVKVNSCFLKIKVTRTLEHRGYNYCKRQNGWSEFFFFKMLFI